MKTERLAYYKSLARLGNKSAQRVVDAFDPDQPRDTDGKWGSGGVNAHNGGTIGQTRSGKAVVAPERDEHLPADLVERGKQHATIHSTGYTRADHYDAHRMLLEAAKTARAHGDETRAYHLGSAASGHKEIARNWKQPASGGAN